MEWVKNNAVEFRSVDPADEDFSDLEPLKKLIGDAQVVQLGEQSHGDGKCFLTKIRLVKFLHQEMGFDVLAFESGLYDCQRAWQAYQEGEDGMSAAQLGVFGIWTGSRQTKPLWGYLEQHATGAKPLELAGFDCQYTAAASSKHLVNDLRSIVADSKFQLTEEKQKQFYSNVKTLASGQVPEGNNNEFLATADALQMHLKSDLPEAVSSNRAMFWKQQLKSMVAHANYHWLDKKPGVMAGVMARDVQMADNLNWLATKRYPNRKIIVWAASFHIVRNIQRIKAPDGSVDYDKMTQMGHAAHESLGTKLYTIGFTAYEGKAGTYFRPSWNVPKAPKGTIEDICFSADLENALVPLTKLDRREAAAEWLGEKRFCRPLGYSWMESVWPENFDAIVFNRTMTPCTR